MHRPRGRGQMSHMGRGGRGPHNINDRGRPGRGGPHRGGFGRDNYRRDYRDDRDRNRFKNDDLRKPGPGKRSYDDKCGEKNSEPQVKQEKRESEKIKDDNDVKSELIQSESNSSENNHRSREKNDNNRDSVASQRSESNSHSSNGPNTKPLGKCRLFIGNLAKEADEKTLTDVFKKFGDITELFVNSAKSFAFVSFSSPEVAAKAKSAMDYAQICGRSVRVRFASVQKALKVKHLSPYVSNEILYEAFSQFGKVDRAVVIVDDKGKPIGEGIVEYNRKNAAQKALQSVNSRVFFLTSELRPVVVEMLDLNDDEDGQSENSIVKTNQYYAAREQGPRFAEPGTFDYDIGLKWKSLYQQDMERKEQIRQRFDEDTKQIEQEMDLVYKEHQARIMREEIQRREQELRKLEEGIHRNTGYRIPPMGMNVGMNMDDQDDRMPPPQAMMRERQRAMQPPPIPPNFDGGFSGPGAHHENISNIARGINLPGNVLANVQRTLAGLRQERH